MMWPGTTISPPNFLTPSRRPRLSRPLREEPPAFLCAICHSFLVPRTARAPDLGNAQHGLLLAMTLLAPVIVPPLFLEDDDLGRPGLLDHGGATEAPSSNGVPVATSAPSPIISTSPSSIVAPGSPASFSTEMTSSLATLYCLPPVRITANMIPPIWVSAPRWQPPKTRRTGSSRPLGAHL